MHGEVTTARYLYAGLHLQRMSVRYTCRGSLDSFFPMLVERVERLGRDVADLYVFASMGGALPTGEKSMRGGGVHVRINISFWRATRTRL